MYKTYVITIKSVKR